MSEFSAPICEAQSMGASYTSNWINVRNFACFAIHYWLTSAGTANGTITFEVSAEDHSFVRSKSGESVIANWVTHPVALTSVTTITIAAGSPDTGLINFVDQGYKWIRLLWTRSSGTGTLDVRLTAKAGIP
jgi:hypothetical protein